MNINDLVVFHRGGKLLVVDSNPLRLPIMGEFSKHFSIIESSSDAGVVTVASATGSEPDGWSWRSAAAFQSQANERDFSAVASAMS